MKGSFWYSVFKEKCPVCHEGDVFLDSNPYHLKTLDKMHRNCSCCGHKFEKEHGFWYGSMYISYGLTVILSSAVFLITYLLSPVVNAWLYIGVIIFVVFVLAPITFRLSRMLWMNIFSHYDPLKAKGCE